MARHAVERMQANGRGLWRLLLADAPGRRAFALRQALVCAAVAWMVERYQTPDPALTVYVVFFLGAADRMTSVVMTVAETLLVTLVIALVLAVAVFAIDDALARVACMAGLSFGLLFLGSASKLRPVAPILALVAGYGLDLLGGFHSGEVATRALLYAWLFVGIPAGVSLLAGLLVAPAPRRLAARALAGRLRLCAAMLREPDARTRRAFAEDMAGAPGKLPVWLKMAALERTSPPEDIAALRQAESSSIALLLLVDLATRAGGVALPAAWRARLARTAEAMAGIFDDGGYPLDVALPASVAGPPPTPSQAALLDDLRDVLVRFAEPPSVAAPSHSPSTTTVAAPSPSPAADGGEKEEAKSGFLLPDAFSNPVHVQYALKTTAAAMFCYVLYELLDWPGIHTCFITCYIVALPTAAETVEKLTLRIAGCLVGAGVGTAALVCLIPATTSIGGLMAIVFLAGFACAWIAAGSPKIAYAGFQVAFAFLLCVMQGSGPAFDLAIARDRAIGILLGNVVTYLVFTRIWPVGVAGRVDPALAALLRRLGGMTTATTAAARRAGAAQALAEGAGVLRDLELTGYEPSPLRPPPRWLRQRRAFARRTLAAAGPLLFAAGRAGAPTAAFARRLEAVARRLETGEAWAVAAGERGEHRAIDPAWASGDAALRSIERAVPDKAAAAGDAEPAHALA